MVIGLEQGADLHMAQLMPLPLTVSCFSKIQIGFTFLALAHLGSSGKRAVKRVRNVKLTTDQIYVVLFLFTVRHCSIISRRSAASGDCPPNP